MWQAHVTKTTANGKSHGMRAVCKLSWMKNLKAGRTSLLRERYSTRKFESFQVGVIEKRYNCELAHCSLLWSPCDRRCVEIILDKNSISVPLLWLPWHQFELDVWSWLVASFRVRDRKYLSVGSIFRISVAVMVFRDVVKIPQVTQG